MMTSHSFFLLLLIMTSGGLCAEWSVTYSPKDICALEGSSVVMSCSYTYPSGLTVTDAFWINQDSENPVDFSQNDDYKHRVTVNSRDKQKKCSLQMHRITKADARMYYCRITTNSNTERWIGKPGISLGVTGLQVGSSARGAAVKEEDDVTLTCKTTCSLAGSPSFIWSKDGSPVEKKRQSTSNQLQLHAVSREDEGSYTCAVRGHDDLPSPPVRLKVHCKKDVTSNKDNVKEGDNVTLTCKTTCSLSASTSFIWSKDGRPVEKKKQSTSNQLQLHPVSREDEGNYTCAVRGHEKLPSPPFRLNVHCLQTVQTDKDKVKEGDIVTLTCNTTCPLGGSTTFIWSKDGLRVQKKQITNNQLQLHPVTYKDNGSYTCAVTGHEGLPSPPLVLTFLCQTFVTPATDKVKEGDDVTLSCNTTCPLGGSTSFIWSKNGGPVEEKRQSTSNQLQLHPVSRGDAGSYTCAVRGHDASSEPFVLKVKESHSHTLLIAVLALVVFCVLAGLLCIICRCRQPKASATENSRAQRKVDQGGDEVQGRAARPHYAEATGGAEADAQYSTIQPHCSRETTGGAEADDQYSTIQPHCSRETAGGAEADDQYSTIQPHCSRGTTGGQEEDEDADDDDDDVQYASIQFKKDKKRSTAGKKKTGGAEGGGDDVEYSSIQPRHLRQTAGAQGDDVQYASVHFKKGKAVQRSPDQPEGEHSVIYSSVQK